MSDTDSDNDYASADEETEESISRSDDVIPISDLAIDSKDRLNTEDGNIIENTVKVLTEDENSAKILPKPEMPPKIEPEMPPKSEPEMPPKNKSETPPRKELELPLENKLERQPTTKPEMPPKHEPNIPLTDELKMPPKYHSEQSIPEAKEYSTHRSNLMRASSESSETKQTVSSNVNVQPKRVTLRLEKKLQERNQVQLPGDVKKEEPKVEEKTSGSWGFGSWGSSLLSTAASSVTTFTSQVSQGLGTVLETVETTLGAPPPEDLAAILKEKRDRELFEKEECKENESEDISEILSTDESRNPEFLEEKGDSNVPATSMLFTGMTSLTKVVGNTGSKVIMGGLDTLEMIGKKTIDILTEGDPGLRKKRSAFSGGVTLSQVLREAKDKAETEQANASSEDQEETVHYSQMFDDYKGLVHLEALEMLSSQCQSKVQRALILSTGESEEKDVIERISRICEDLPSADETPDEEVHQDFEAAISMHLNALQLKISLNKLEKARDSVNDWLNDCLAEQEKGHGKASKEIYRQAIGSLAIFTASCVEHFHKFGELIMVQNDADFDVIMCATHLTGLTSVLCTEITILATKFCQCLNTAADDSEDPDSITPLITNVYLEASNSTTYVQDAFQLLVPVLQTSLLQ